MASIRNQEGIPVFYWNNLKQEYGFSNETLEVTARTGIPIPSHRQGEFKRQARVFPPSPKEKRVDPESYKEKFDTFIKAMKVYHDTELKKSGFTLDEPSENTQLSPSQKV